QLPEGIRVTDLAWSTVARRYRHAIVLAAAVGVLALVMGIAIGHVLAGVFVCAGLGLGVYNGHRLWSDTTKFTAGGVAQHRSFMVGTLRRLGFVTFLAVLAAVLFRPLGWTVFLGLVIFQLVMIGNVLGPLRRAIRA